MDLTGKLIEKGLLSEEDVSLIEQETEEGGKTEEEVLLEKGKVPEEELFSVKSEITGVPFKKDIKAENIPPEVLRIIPEESATHYKMVPVEKTDEGIKIGMVYPENLRSREALKFISRKEDTPYEVYLISLSAFREILRRYKGSSPEEMVPLLEKLTEEGLLNREEALAIEKEAEEEGKSAEEILLRREKISEEDLFSVKSEVTGFPLKKEVDAESISSETLSLIHEDSASYYKMVPLGREEETVEVGMVYPEDLRAQEALKFISRQDIFAYKVSLIPFSVFEEVRGKYGSLGKEPGAEIIGRLIEKNILSEEQAKEVEKEAEDRGKTREEILLEKETVSEEELFNLKSELTNIPFKREVHAGEADQSLLEIFPREVIEHYKMIPVGKEGEVVEVGMVYPEDRRAKEVLDLISKKENVPYRVCIISLSEFRKASKEIRAATKDLGSALSEKLVAEGFLDEDKAKEIDEEAEKREKTREEILIEEKLISEEELFSLKSEAIGVPYRNDVKAENISEDLLRIIPEDSANYYKMAPIGKEGEEIEIGMVYPENLRSQEALKFLSRRDNFPHKVFLISLSTFEDISKQYRTLKEEVGKALEELEMEIEPGEEERIDIEKDVGRLAEEAPIVKVVTVILRNAIEGGASDIHIEPAREKLKVRFRVDGVLYSSIYLPMGIHLAVIARTKILAGLKIDEQRLPQDGRFSTKVGKKNIDFRVSTFPTTLGEKVVIRVLDPEAGLKSIGELGVSGKNFEILNQSVKKPTGLTLVTGPTGSGKTTTLYAILKILNDERVNIVTLEDPVEYFIDGVNQSQTHSEIGYVFSKGLRQILRQDPDVIMVGEIRDEETADLAIHASLTGHVVLSTLHTNDALGVIPRLIDMGIKPFLIPPALNTMMSQRLVRRLCDQCREQITPSEEIKAMITEELDKISPEVLKEFDIPSPLKIYQPKGCKHCSEEGFKGRTGIFEVLRMTERLGKIIMKSPTISEMHEEALNQGMITLKQDGIIKVIRGETALEEVLRAMEEK